MKTSMPLTSSALERKHSAFASVIIYLFIKFSKSVVLVNTKKVPHFRCLSKEIILTDKQIKYFLWDYMYEGISWKWQRNFLFFISLCLE